MKTSFRSVLLSVLWLLWFVLLPGTFGVVVVTGDSSWSRFWWMSSAVLSMSAWLNWFFHRRDRLGLSFALIALGMTFGMLADLYGAFEAIRFTEPLTMIVPLFALGHIGDLCWITYGIGQMLIVYGAIASSTRRLRTRPTCLGQVGGSGAGTDSQSCGV